jgi:hypothetical protein
LIVNGDGYEDLVSLLALISSQARQEQHVRAKMISVVFEIKLKCFTMNV